MRFKFKGFENLRTTSSLDGQHQLRESLQQRHSVQLAATHRLTLLQHQNRLFIYFVTVNFKLQISTNIKSHLWQVLQVHAHLDTSRMKVFLIVIKQVNKQETAKKKKIFFQQKKNET